MELYIIIHSLVILSLLFEFFPGRQQSPLVNIRQKRIIIVLWCIFFTLFGGLRWIIGGDWGQYYDHYLGSLWSNIFNYDRYGNGRETLEPGFVFINVLIKTIFGKFYFYNLIICGFIQYSYYKFSNLIYPQRPLLVYVFFMTFISNYFPVRAGLSFGIVLWAYFFLYKDELKKSILFFLIACSIHLQCVALAPLYFLHRIKINYITACGIYFGAFFLSYIFQDYFTQLSILVGGDIGDKAEMYTRIQTENYEEKSGFGYMGLLLNYIFLSSYYYIRKWQNLADDNFYTKCLNGFLIYISVYMVFSNGMGDLTRLANIYFPCQIYLLFHNIQYFLSELEIKATQHRRSNKYRILTILFIILYLLYRVPNNWSGYFFLETNVPYKTIFDYGIIN